MASNASYLFIFLLIHLLHLMRHGVFIFTVKKHAVKKHLTTVSDKSKVSPKLK